jgi:hypothetical protein
VSKEAKIDTTTAQRRRHPAVEHDKRKQPKNAEAATFTHSKLSNNYKINGDSAFVSMAEASVKGVWRDSSATMSMADRSMQGMQEAAEYVSIAGRKSRCCSGRQPVYVKWQATSVQEVRRAAEYVSM